MLHTKVVDTDAERASLMFPVVYVFDVPVLWFPWLSMPLNDRQTGLLVPHPTFTALSGFYIDAPVFITLGRSADLTLTPSYFGGQHGVYGVRGPQLLAELRYATSPATTGRITFGLLYDTRQARDPNDPTLGPDGKPLVPTDGSAVPKEPMRGLRAQGSWQHTQTLGAGWYDRVNAAFLSDGYMNRDFTADVLAREAGYLRSTATLFHKGEDHFIGIDAVVRQDLSTGYSIFSNGGPNPFQRLPGLTLAIPNKLLAGPLAFSLSAEAVRLAPTLYQKTDGIYDPALGARIYAAGDRQARDRLDVMPRLEVAGALGGILGASAFAAWRQDVWMPEITKTPTQRGYALLGARVDTELARSFGDSLRHVIAPSLEVRAVPYVVGQAPTPYDEIDAAIPDNQPHVQAVAQIRQRLLHKEGAAVREWLRLDLGQGADLLTARLGESFARISTSFWLARATATVRVDPVLARLTRISGLAAVDDNKGTGLYVSYENLLDDGTDRARAPVDLLFGPSITPLTATNGRAQIVTCGAHWRLGGFGARYDAVFQQVPRFNLSTVDPRVAPTQQTIGLSYGPACNCWRAEAFATYRGHQRSRHRFHAHHLGLRNAGHERLNPGKRRSDAVARAQSLSVPGRLPVTVVDRLLEPGRAAHRPRRQPAADVSNGLHDRSRLRADRSLDLVPAGLPDCRAGLESDPGVDRPHEPRLRHLQRAHLPHLGRLQPDARRVRLAR